jgi:hypothetical protein
MEISRDEFNDVGEPVLSDGSNHIDLDLILNVPLVSVVGDLSGVYFDIASNLTSHDSLILFGFVGWLHIPLIDDV